MSLLKNKGWVRIHRKIEDNGLWFLEPFTKAQAWIDLFLNANHKNGLMQIRGNVIPIERGQIGWSEQTMVLRWKWSKNKVRRFLKLLETIKQIEQQKDRYITTIITILNYEKYQNDKADDKADDKAEGQQTIKQTIHKQECKNEKNVNIDNIYTFYKEKINQLSGLTSNGKNKIKIRLKGFSEEELRRAIENFAGDKWWMEKNAGRGVAWFFNSDDRIDQFLNIKNKSNQVEKIWNENK